MAARLYPTGRLTLIFPMLIIELRKGNSSYVKREFSDRERSIFCTLQMEKQTDQRVPGQTANVLP